LGSPVLRPVLGLVVTAATNKDVDRAATFDLHAISPSAGPLQVPIALYRQAPFQTGAERSIGGAHCRRGGDETSQSEVRVSENRPAALACFRRRARQGCGAADLAAIRSRRAARQRTVVAHRSRPRQGQSVEPGLVSMRIDPAAKLLG